MFQPEQSNQPQPDKSDVNEARHFSHFIQMVEDGIFHSDLSDQLTQIQRGLAQHQHNFGGKPKAELTIKLSFQLDAGVFEIIPESIVKLPKAKRGRTVAWGTPDGNFTQSNPRQMALFGPRDVVTSQS